MKKIGILQRLENKIGKYAIKNLIVYILLAYVVGYLLQITDSKLGFYEYIMLDPEMVMQGQVWRLFTWIFTVPQTLSFFVVFMFLFYYFIGKSLERELGAFKYNVYMFSGWFFMTLGSMVFYWITTAMYGAGMGISLNVSTYYLNLASFLAFALLFPNAQVYFFFILPIKIKWLAILDVIYMVYKIVQYIISLGHIGSIDFSMYGITESYYKAALYAEIFSIIISLLNFVIFFLCYKNMNGISYRQRLANAKTQRERRAAFVKAKQEEVQREWDRRQQNNNGYNNSGYNNNGFGNQNGSQNNNQDDSFKPEGGFMGWADWYDPDETDEQRERRAEQYKNRMMQNAESREEKKKRKRTAKYGVQEFEHKCDVCGRTNVTNPELSFRYCSKCDGNHEYCEDHIFTHEHVHNK